MQYLKATGIAACIRIFKFVFFCKEKKLWGFLAYRNETNVIAIHCKVEF